MFTCHAACHERTLSGMKTTDCTTSYTDKHNREDRQQGSIGMRVLQSVPYLRQCGMVDVKHYQNTDSHKQQGYGKQRIYLADNFIYRQQCSKNIISKYYNNPESGVQTFGSQLGKQSGRACHEYRPYQYHQDNSKATHHLLSGQPQITSDDFRKALSSMTQ